MQGVVEMVPELKAQIEAQQIQIRDQQVDLTPLQLNNRDIKSCPLTLTKNFVIFHQFF